MRLLVLAAALALLAWGLLGERHAVRSFAGPEVRELSGGSLSEGGDVPWWPRSLSEAAATDALVLRSDGLYHLATLAPEQATLKDCKT